MIPSPSTSGTTLAQVTIARSRFASDGAELATAQPIRKCVIGLIRLGDMLFQYQWQLNATDKTKRALTRANAKMPRRRPIETAARQVTDSSFWQARRPANRACGWHEGLSAEAAGSRQGENE